MLRHISQRHNVKLRDVTQQVHAERTDPVEVAPPSRYRVAAKRVLAH